MYNMHIYMRTCIIIINVVTATTKSSNVMGTENQHLHFLMEIKKVATPEHVLHVCRHICTQKYYTVNAILSNIMETGVI